MILELLEIAYIFILSFGVAFIVWGFLNFLQGKYGCERWDVERSGYRQMIVGLLMYAVATLIK